MIGDNSSKVVMLGVGWGGGGWGVKSRVVICHNWPLAHLFPPQMLVMV